MSFALLLFHPEKYSVLLNCLYNKKIKTIHFTYKHIINAKTNTKKIMSNGRKVKKREIKIKKYSDFQIVILTD